MMVPRPVAAVLLLYPISEKVHASMRSLLVLQCIYVRSITTYSLKAGILSYSCLFELCHSSLVIMVIVCQR